MSRKQSAVATTVSGTNSDLASLIEMEQRLGERMEQVRREGDALRQRARDSAREAETALEQELATHSTALATQSGEQLRVEISAVERDGQAVVARSAGLGDPASERLAEAAVRQLRASGGGYR